MRHGEVFLAWQKLIWHRYYLGTASVNHLMKEVVVYSSIRNELPESFACLVTNIGQAYMVDLLYVMDPLWFVDCNLTVACPSGSYVLYWSKCRIHSSSLDSIVLGLSKTGSASCSCWPFVGLWLQLGCLDARDPWCFPTPHNKLWNFYQILLELWESFDNG